jgi:hypothetical protein
VGAVVLLGPRGEAEVEAVAGRLAEAGAEHVVWDSSDWTDPAAASFSLDARGELQRVGDTELSSVGALWLRNMGLDPAGSAFGEALEARPFSLLNQLREYGGALSSALRLLEDRGVPVINPRESVGIHALKLLQTHRFREAGLPVARTLVSNDPEQVRAFAAEHAEVIYKPVAGHGYARLLESEDLAGERLELLRNVPVQFQERLVGRSLRVYVLGGEVVGAGRIVSDALDYRTGEHDVERLEDPEAERMALTAAAAVGLTFSGVDLIQGAEGQLHVLEANPSPMFVVFDRLAGTDVAGALAAHLRSLAS